MQPSYNELGIQDLNGMSVDLQRGRDQIRAD